MAKSAIAALLCIAVGSALAGPLEDAAKLRRFATANEGRFPPELRDVPSSLVLRASAPRNLMLGATYDYRHQVLVSPFMAPLSTIDLSSICRQAGSFVGTGFLGQKVRVQRLDCAVLQVEDADADMFLGEPKCDLSDFAPAVWTDAEEKKACDSRTQHSLALKMTPNEYREFLARGLTLEFVFAPGKRAKAEVVKTETTQTEATLRSPQQTLFTTTQVVGTIESVVVLSHDGKRRLGEFRRAPAS